MSAVAAQKVAKVPVAKVTKVEKEKAKKPALSNHPLVGSKDPAKYPFKSTPADYSFETMKPLKRPDFAGVAEFIDYRASRFDWMAEQLRAKAQDYRTHGGPAAGKAKRLIRLTKQMEELKKLLAEQGVDVDAVLAQAAEVE